MSRNFDITSANSESILIVEKLFPAGIELQMFSTDSAVTLESLEVAATRMGVDGKMVAGFTPNICTVTITLEAASPSFQAFATVWSAMSIKKTIYECTLVSNVPSIGKSFTFARGVMKSGAPFPNIVKVLDPTTWVFDFERMFSVNTF